MGLAPRALARLPASPAAPPADLSPRRPLLPLASPPSCRDLLCGRPLQPDRAGSAAQRYICGGGGPPVCRAQRRYRGCPRGAQSRGATSVSASAYCCARRQAMLHAAEPLREPPTNALATRATPPCPRANAAAWDASIAAYTYKYEKPTWRPITAIRWGADKRTTCAVGAGRQRSHAVPAVVPPALRGGNPTSCQWPTLPPPSV